MDPRQRRRNTVLMLSLVVLITGMVGLSFASVPLYRAFCRVTGFGGTTQRVETASARVVDRTIRIHFNADIDRNLPWSFKPEVPDIRLKLGQTGLVNFRAENRSNRTVTSTAVYNVTPDNAGIYFNKIQCFCFNEQQLEAGQAVDMPVSFYVDPSLADDPDMKGVDTITLSYTLFEAKPGAGLPVRTYERKPVASSAGVAGRPAVN